MIAGSFLGALLARLFATAEPNYVPAVILVNGGSIPELPALAPKLVNLPVVGRLSLEIIGASDARQVSR